MPQVQLSVAVESAEAPQPQTAKEAKSQDPQAAKRKACGQLAGA